MDMTILRWFNGLAGKSHGIDTAVVLFTDYAPVIFGVLFMLYFVRRRGDVRRIRRTVVLSGVAGVLALGVSVAIAAVFYRARPFAALPLGQVHLLIPHPPDSSFPSDHASGAGAFAVGMWRAPGRSARWVFLVTALLVGVSRLVAGVHWPTDILMSWILGGLCAWVVFTLARPLRPVIAWVLGVYAAVESRLFAQR